MVKTSDLVVIPATEAWPEVLRALMHNAGLYANDVPHIDHVALKRELRKQCEAARKLLSVAGR